MNDLSITTGGFLLRRHLEKNFEGSFENIKYFSLEILKNEYEKRKKSLKVVIHMLCSSSFDNFSRTKLSDELVEITVTTFDDNFKYLYLIGFDYIIDGSETDIEVVSSPAFKLNTAIQVFSLHFK